MMYNTRLDEDYIVRNLLDADRRLQNRLGGITYRQLSFFDDNTYADIMPNGFAENNSYGVINGQL